MGCLSHTAGKVGGQHLKQICMFCNWLGGMCSCGVSISYSRQSRGSAPKTDMYVL